LQHGARGFGPAPFLSGPPLAPGGPSLGQLMSRRRFACGANHPIRLFQNVGVFRLFSRKKTEHHKRRAEKRAYQRNSPIGSSVSTMKRSRHRSTPTQSESAAALEGDGFRTASRRLKNGFVDRHLDCATGGAVDPSPTAAAIKRRGRLSWRPLYSHAWV
jgi:hypothetical protein